MLSSRALLQLFLSINSEFPLNPFRLFKTYDEVCPKSARYSRAKAVLPHRLDEASSKKPANQRMPG